MVRPHSRPALALGCPDPRGKEWTQAGQRTLEWRELQVEPETIAIPLLINEEPTNFLKGNGILHVH